MCVCSNILCILGNNDEDISKINKVILTSGKHYYALENYRKTIGENNVAIIRLECLCPFPVQELLEEIQKYNHAKRKYNKYWNPLN